MDGLSANGMGMAATLAFRLKECGPTCGWSAPSASWRTVGPAGRQPVSFLDSVVLYHCGRRRIRFVALADLFDHLLVG